MANQLNLTSSNPLPITLGGTGNSTGASTLTATTSTSTNATFYPLFVSSSSNSNQSVNLGTGLTFNPSTNILTTTEYDCNKMALGATASAISGVTPVMDFSSNFSDGNYLRFSTNGAIGVTSAGRPFISRNLDYDGTAGSYKYMTSTSACAIEISTSSINLLTAGAGTAGNSVTPSATMAIVSSSVSINNCGLFINNGSNSSITIDNSSPLHAKNSSGTAEIWIYPRYSDNFMYLQYGSGGFILRNNSNSAALEATNGLDVNISAGSLSIQTTTKGLKFKSTAVSAGTANSLMVTGCVLVTGTVTINNSSVTTSHRGIPMLQTAGGTVGGWSVSCGSGTFTITSTSALDTSTLSVLFVLPN